jgi:hypothetical protein
VLRARVAVEPLRSAMSDAWATEGLEGFLSHYVARSSFVPALLSAGAAPINSDDRNVIEFAFARSLGSQAAFDRQRALAREGEQGRHAASREGDRGLEPRPAAPDLDDHRRRRGPARAARHDAGGAGAVPGPEGLPREQARERARSLAREAVGAGRGHRARRGFAGARPGGRRERGRIHREAVRVAAARRLILPAELRWRQGRFPESAILRAGPDATARIGRSFRSSTAPSSSRTWPAAIRDRTGRWTPRCRSPSRSSS